MQDYLPANVLNHILRFNFGSLCLYWFFTERNVYCFSSKQDLNHSISPPNTQIFIREIFSISVSFLVISNFGVNIDLHFYSPSCGAYLNRHMNTITRAHVFWVSFQVHQATRKGLEMFLSLQINLVIKHVLSACMWPRRSALVKLWRCTG